MGSWRATSAEAPASVPEGDASGVPFGQGRTHVQDWPARQEQWTGNSWWNGSGLHKTCQELSYTSGTWKCTDDMDRFSREIGAHAGGGSGNNEFTGRTQSGSDVHPHNTSGSAEGCGGIAAPPDAEAQRASKEGIGGRGWWEGGSWASVWRGWSAIRASWQRWSGVTPWSQVVEPHGSGGHCTAESAGHIRSNCCGLPDVGQRLVEQTSGTAAAVSTITPYTSFGDIGVGSWWEHKAWGRGWQVMASVGGTWQRYSGWSLWNQVRHPQCGGSGSGGSAGHTRLDPDIPFDVAQCSADGSLHTASSVAASCTPPACSGESDRWAGRDWGAGWQTVATDGGECQRHFGTLPWMIARSGACGQADLMQSSSRAHLDGAMRFEEKSLGNAAPLDVKVPCDSVEHHIGGGWWGRRAWGSGLRTNSGGAGPTGHAQRVPDTSAGNPLHPASAPHLDGTLSEISTTCSSGSSGWWGCSAWDGWQSGNAVPGTTTMVYPGISEAHPGAESPGASSSVSTGIDKAVGVAVQPCATAPAASAPMCSGVSKVAPSTAKPSTSSEVLISIGGTASCVDQAVIAPKVGPVAPSVSDVRLETAQPCVPSEVLTGMDGTAGVAAQGDAKNSGGHVKAELSALEPNAGSPTEERPTPVSIAASGASEEPNLWANFSKRLPNTGMAIDRPLEPAALPPRSAPQRLAVLLHEAVQAVMQGGGPDATYVDCTFGRGGHAVEILRQLSTRGTLITFDIDPSAVACARALERADARLKCHHRPHGDLAKVVGEDVMNLGGVLLDLGSYSTQAEERSRGFSFVDDGPLDLRLNPGYGMPAYEWLQTVSVAELAWVIHEHGEDNDVVLSQRLAEGILERQRRLGPYRSSLELADVCREVKQGLDDRGQHPAKLTFQAIRCFLNHEVEQLDLALHGAMERLKPGGRCVIISYRRKEAALVKRFIREHEEADPRFASFVTPQRLAELYPLLTTDHPWSCRQTCEPIRPTPQECDRNPRARPAQIHVLTKELRDFTKSPCRGMKPRPESEQFKRPTPLPFQGAAVPEVAEFSHL